MATFSISKNRLQNEGFVSFHLFYIFTFLKTTLLVLFGAKGLTLSEKFYHISNNLFYSWSLVVGDTYLSNNNNKINILLHKISLKCFLIYLSG